MTEAAHPPDRLPGELSLPDDIQEKLLGVECYQRRDLVPGGCDLI